MFVFGQNQQEFGTLHCYRLNLAVIAEARALTAPTADEERGARSYPTAKSALRRKNTRIKYAKNQTFRRNYKKVRKG